MAKISLVFLFTIISISLWSAVGFVVNSGSETLSLLDFETGGVNNAFAVLGSMPNRVALTQEYAYVVNSGDNNVQKINLQSGATEALIFIGLSTNPYDIIIENNYAYVSGGLSNKIYKLDLNPDEVVDEVNVGGNPAGMAIYNGKLYVGNTDYSNFYANCSISVIDLYSFEVITTVPSEINPQFLKVINDKIHISCGGDWGSIGGKICILDPLTDEITAILEIGGVTYNLAVTPDDIVYVSDGFGYNLFAYDASDLSIIYNAANPFTPGGTMVAANAENLFVLGGEWGQNFSVKKYDFNENLLAEYSVGLYSTDIKLLPIETNSTQNPIPNTQYHLSNYPNPFNTSTEIRFQTSEFRQIDHAEIEIYNLKGQKVKTLPVSPSQSHTVSIIWDGTDNSGIPVTSGIYFYKLNLPESPVRKMILLK